MEWEMFVRDIKKMLIYGLICSGGGGRDNVEENGIWREEETWWRGGGGRENHTTREKRESEGKVEREESGRTRGRGVLWRRGETSRKGKGKERNGYSS